MKRRLTLALSALALTLSLSSAALADSVTFTLGNPTQSTTAGKVISYSATVTAAPSNTGLEYLNGLDYNFTAPSNFALDINPFLTNFPFFLAAGQSFTGTIFTLTVPANSSISSFFGSVSLLGGSTADSQGVLGSTLSFTTTVTPEPSTWALLATGMVGVFVLSRRTRQGAAAPFRL